MIMQAWPFLISRNKVLDYRTVVAPDFMRENQTAPLLAKSAGGTFTEPNTAVLSTIPNAKVTLVFRVLTARAQYLAKYENKEDDTLRDSDGRPIKLIEGIVLRGLNREISITADIFDEVHRQLQNDFQRFWEETPLDTSIKFSYSFQLEISKTTESMKIIPSVTNVLSPPSTTINSPKHSEPSLPQKPRFDMPRVANQVASRLNSLISVQPTPSYSSFGDDIDPDKARKKSDEAWQVYNNNGSPYEALRLCDEAIRLDPNSVDAYRCKGLILIKRGSYPNALKAFNKAISLDSNNATLYGERGHALIGLKHYQEALDSFNKVISLDPNIVFAYIDKGSALLNLKQFEEALLAFEKVIELDINSPDGYLNKGWTLIKLGQYQTAIETLDELISRENNIPGAYNYKGLALENLGLLEEALVAFDKAIHLAPNWSLLYNNKGLVLERMNRLREALEMFKQAVRLEPRNYEAQDNELRVHLRIMRGF